MTREDAQLHWRVLPSPLAILRQCVDCVVLVVEDGGPPDSVETKSGQTQTQTLSTLTKSPFKDVTHFTVQRHQICRFILHWERGNWPLCHSGWLGFTRLINDSYLNTHPLDEVRISTNALWVVKLTLIWRLDQMIVNTSHPPKGCSRRILAFLQLKCFWRLQTTCHYNDKIHKRVWWMELVTERRLATKFHRIAGLSSSKSTLASEAS